MGLCLSGRGQSRPIPMLPRYRLRRRPDEFYTVGHSPADTVGGSNYLPTYRRRLFLARVDGLRGAGHLPYHERADDGYLPKASLAV